MRLREFTKTCDRLVPIGVHYESAQSQDHVYLIGLCLDVLPPGAKNSVVRLGVVLSSEVGKRTTSEVAGRVMLHVPEDVPRSRRRTRKPSIEVRAYQFFPQGMIVRSIGHSSFELGNTF